MIDNFNLVIEAVLAVFAGVSGFFVGKRKSDAEATQTAFEAYNVALNALKQELADNKSRWEQLEADLTEKIRRQDERIKQLENENRELRNRYNK